MPPTRAFSRQLVAYIACFLPVATYMRANDGRISGDCCDQYTATLERGERRRGVQALHRAQDPGMVPALGSPLHFRRCRLLCPWRRPGRRLGVDAGAAAFPAPDAAPGARASTPARLSPPPPAPPPAAIRGPGVGHTPSKTSRLQSAAFLSSPLPSSSPRLCQASLACAIGYAHIEIFCLQNCVNVGIECDIIGEIIDEIMDVIIYDIIDL